MTISRSTLVALAAVAGALACAHSPSKKEREAAEIHYQLGVESLNANRREDAMREFGDALRLDAGHVPALLGRGVVHQYFGKLAEAEGDYRRALELDPNFSEAHNALGQLLAQTNRLEPAIREFDLAIANMLYREAYVARCNKGQALARLGRVEEAKAEVKSCLNLQPRYCAGHRELGRIDMEQGRTKDAVQSFRRYAELCGRSADAWFQLGLAQMKAGDPQRAREAFEKCEGLGAGGLDEECRRKAKALE